MLRIFGAFFISLHMKKDSFAIRNVSD